MKGAASWPVVVVRPMIGNMSPISAPEQVSGQVVTYDRLLGPSVSTQLLEECAKLYSEQYGRWGDGGVSPGARIRLPSARIRKWLESKDSELAFARASGELIGYAICVRTKEKHYGVVSWVTQLVVHEDYRNQNVGQTLLYWSWEFSDHYCWGIVTANPYAIRALEKATRRRCDPVRIRRNKRKLLSIGISNVPYIPKENPELEVSEHTSRINTRFFVDHVNLGSMIANVTSDKVPWLMGELPDGWEWFAFTFHDQEQLRLTSEEIKDMLAVSDDMVRIAYSRMRVTQDSHPWARHTKREVELIMTYCKIGRGASVLDIGCGTGRHALELAAQGVGVTGVDYVAKFVDAAELSAHERGIEATFVDADCRDLSIGREYDAVICLYDVIGTYADLGDNIKIIEQIYRHLKPGGFALLSVMNYEVTERKATQFFSINESPDKLLSLPAKNIMESTGNIFDPDYYIIDSETKVVYRKEQFLSGRELPTEIIVRDRRFTEEEIRTLCARAGLIVAWSRFVRAGNWDPGEGRDSVRAKEILVLCQRPDDQSGINVGS